MTIEDPKKIKVEQSDPKINQGPQTLLEVSFEVLKLLKEKTNKTEVPEEENLSSQ